MMAISGFYISDISTPGSVGTAGMANPVNIFDSASAITQPAAWLIIEKDLTRVVGQILYPVNRLNSDVASASGSDGGNSGIAGLAPSLSAVKVLNDDWRLGIGVTATLGGGWDYGEDFVGYKYMKIKYDNDRSGLNHYAYDAEQQGPVAGLSIKF